MVIVSLTSNWVRGIGSQLLCPFAGSLSGACSAFRCATFNRVPIVTTCHISTLSTAHSREVLFFESGQPIAQFSFVTFSSDRAVTLVASATVVAFFLLT